MSELDSKIIQSILDLSEGNYNIDLPRNGNQELTGKVHLAIHHLAEILQKNQPPTPKQADENLNKTLHYLKLIVDLRSQGYENFSNLFESYLEIGCEILNIPFGIVLKPENKAAICLAQTSSLQEIEIGDGFQLEGTISQDLLVSKDLVAKVSEPHQHIAFGQVELYIGIPIFVNGRIYALLEFADKSNLAHELGMLEKELVKLISQEIGTAITDLISRQERNKVESALLASKEQFRHLVDNIPGAVYRRSVNRYDKFEFISSEVESITGYPASHFDSVDKYYNLIHPDDWHWIESRLEEVIKTRTSINLEYRIIHRNKSIKWVSERGMITYARFFDGFVFDGVILDITERKETEQALAKSENRYKLVTSYSQIGIWDFNLSLDEHYLSPNLYKMLGYVDHDTITDMQDYTQLTLKEDLHILEKHIYQQPVDKQITNFEFITRKIHQSGSVRWIHTRGTIIRNHQLQIERIAGLDEDITNRKLTEQALQKSEERYSLATISGSISVWDFNLKNEDFYLGNNLKNLLGYKSHEVPNHPEAFIKLIHPEDQARIRQLMEEHLEGKTNIYEAEYRMVHKDGSIKWILTRGTAFRNEDGEVYRMAGSDMDITDRKMAEVEVLSTRQQLQYLFDNLEAVFLSMDPVHQKIIQISPSIEKLLECSLDDIEMNYEFWKSFLHQEDLHLMQELISQLVDTLQQNVELRIHTATGQQKWISADITTTLDKDNVPIRYDCIVTDITERKKQTEVIQAKELAERALHFKTEFLASMSHEIRTPMNGIVGMTELLMDTSLNNQQIEFIQTIQRSSKSLLAIINEILDLSKLEAGKMSVKPNIFNIHKLIQQVKDLFIPVIRDKEVNLKIEIEPEVPEFINADETKVNQVMTNLVSNAAKFTEEGTIRIRLLKDQENFLKVEVIDTGAGIDKEDMNKLFQKFTQLNTPTKRKYAGTGLGLTICQHLVTLMEGEIKVASEKHKGSNFNFTFRYENVDQTKHLDQFFKSPEKENKPQQINAHVLVVEDNTVNQQVVSLMLKKFGCTTDIAKNGIEALNKVKEEKYDLILMDIQMPLMDGMEATMILKTKYQDVPPIIGLSANAMEGDAEKYIKDGMDDYLAKPITSDQLIKKLQKWTTMAKPVAKVLENKVEYIGKLDILNQNTLNEIKTISGNDTQMVNELYQSFIDDSKSLIKKAQKALQKNDLNLMNKSIHTLKGLSGTVGASRIFEISKTINYQLSTSNYKDLDKLIAQLQPNLDQFINFINKNNFSS